jgi:hypothetical protein
MFKRIASGRLAVGVLVAVALLPAVAYAGKRVVSGQVSLQIKVTLGRTRANARGVSLRLVAHTMSTKPGGGQPPYNARSITFIEPPGMRMNPSVLPKCRESAVRASKTGAAVCPADTKVGTGTVVINARPAVPALIAGTVTAYNAVDDGGFGGYPKGSPEVMLDIATSLGIGLSEPLHIVVSGGRVELIVNLPRASAPGPHPGDFTLQRLNLTLAGPRRKPYIVNPPTCPGSWPFSLTIRNWFGPPPITARDRVSCRG